MNYLQLMHFEINKNLRVCETSSYATAEPDDTLNCCNDIIILDRLPEYKQL